uniref:Poly polymerase 12 n=1 Tax=Esox lucius TaxID=8010 RepID=C1BZT1_ESOLU|nr:Poly polymerase 12 [Esox lucius]
MESTVTKLICANNGSMNVNDIEAMCGVSVRDVILNLDRLCLVVFNGEQRVVAKTVVRLCKSQDCHGCRNLHFCKRFLFGECPFVQRRGGCRFSHELTSGNNRIILKENGLEKLDKAELCTLLLQNDRFLLPPVCHDHNNDVGEYGKCEEREKCKRLHICETYLRDNCNCPGCHDFFEPHPFQSLQDRGVPVKLIGSLKSVYMNAEWLQKQDRAKQGKQAKAQVNAIAYTRNQSNRVPESSQSNGNTFGMLNK